MQATIGTFELVIGGSIMIFIISGLFIILYYHFSRKVIINELQQNNLNLEHQKELLRNEIAVIENERKRIARDLHDEIGANMAYIGIALAQLSKECPNSLAFNEKLAICQTQLNKTITDVRRISHDLLPPILEMFGLTPALNEFINNISSTFKIEFSYTDAFDNLENETALQLYRVLLEFISNSIKHSGGDLITIQMNTQNSVGKIIYADNGIGFNMEMKRNSNGLGIKNIISRLESIGATYAYNLITDKTFYIEIILNEKSWKDTQ